MIIIEGNIDNKTSSQVLILELAGEMINVTSGRKIFHKGVYQKPDYEGNYEALWSELSSPNYHAYFKASKGLILFNLTGEDRFSKAMKQLFAIRFYSELDHKINILINEYNLIELLEIKTIKSRSTGAERAVGDIDSKLYPKNAHDYYTNHKLKDTVRWDLVNDGHRNFPQFSTFQTHISETPITLNPIYSFEHNNVREWFTDSFRHSNYFSIPWGHFRYERGTKTTSHTLPKIFHRNQDILNYMLHMFTSATYLENRYLEIYPGTIIINLRGLFKSKSHRLHQLVFKSHEYPIRYFNAQPKIVDLCKVDNEYTINLSGMLGMLPWIQYIYTKHVMETNQISYAYRDRSNIFTTGNNYIFYMNQFLEVTKLIYETDDIILGELKYKDLVAMKFVNSNLIIPTKKHRHNCTYISTDFIIKLVSHWPSRTKSHTCQTVSFDETRCICCNDKPIEHFYVASGNVAHHIEGRRNMYNRQSRDHHDPFVSKSHDLKFSFILCVECAFSKYELYGCESDVNFITTTAKNSTNECNLSNLAMCAVFNYEISIGRTNLTMQKAMLVIENLELFPKEIMDIYKLTFKNFHIDGKKIRVGSTSNPIPLSETQALIPFEKHRLYQYRDLTYAVPYTLTT
jgi:hypothetical protein